MKSPVLVELFTSQNCPACPSANEKLIELSETEDIFPLTWSVSYWDYLGWKDTFAKAEFNGRQRSYADAFDLRGPYTPQAVVDGCIQTTGKVSKESVERKIQHAQTPHGYEVGFNLTASGLDLTPVEEIPMVDIWLVGYQPGITAVVPAKGNNKKKMLSHINMATNLYFVGEWDGASKQHFDFGCTDEACLVIVQEQVSKDIVTFEVMPSVEG